MGLNFAEELKRADVMFSARLEAYVLEIGCVWYHRVEHVPQHGSVGFAILNLGGPAGPGNIEEVGDILEVGELRVGLVSVGDIALDVFDRVVGIPGRSRAACQPVDLPGATGGVGEWEDLSKAVADDSCHSDDQGHALILRRCIIFFEFLLCSADCTCPPPAHFVVFGSGLQGENR